MTIYYLRYLRLEISSIIRNTFFAAQLKQRMMEFGIYILH